MTRSQRLTLLAAILGSSAAAIDATIVNVALPTIQDDLGGGLQTQQWISNAYLLTLGALAPAPITVLRGRLADRRATPAQGCGRGARTAGRGIPTSCPPGHSSALTRLRGFSIPSAATTPPLATSTAQTTIASWNASTDS